MIALFFMFGILARHGAGNGMGAPAIALGKAWPALLAQLPGTLPDPKGYEVIGWLIGGLVAIVAALGTVIGVILGLFALIEKIRGARGEVALKQPIITKSSPDGPERVEFGLHVQGLEELKRQRLLDVNELKGMIGEVSDKLDRFSSDNYKRRRAMHREINAQREAMAFLAGTMHKSGDQVGAKKVRDMIRVREEAEEEEPGKE